MLLIIIITIITPFLLCLLLKHFLLEGSTSRSSNPSMHGGYVANCSLYSSVICHAYRPDICIACPAFLFAKKRDKAFFCNLYSASPSQSWELLSCRMVRSGKDVKEGELQNLMYSKGSNCRVDTIFPKERCVR